MKGRVLISTHDLKRAGALRSAFKELGYAVELVTPEEQLAERSDAELLVLSAGAGGPEGEALVGQARALGVPVVGYAAAGADDPARPGAAASGVAELFGPRVPSDEVALLGSRRVERNRLQRITGIVGESEAIREALERVVQIAPVDSTVLLTGESGTGKELVARGIHALSPRRHKAFIPVNVAALPDTLLESELFGHEKGAFTGAIDARKGFFELAHGGTILLDEIGEMPLATQTKLLRVLEQREFVRVGGEKPIRVDVRIIAATNQDLKQLVAMGEFRRDLYYRLNVLSIVLPPLRERAEDVPLLVDAFVREVSAHHDRPFRGISEEAMRILQMHQWPGNVRELRNLVESMVVLAPGRVIQPSDIPPDVRRVDRQRSLVPAPIPRSGTAAASQTLRPELEFIFRTLVELRMDMDQLRREFERYRSDASGPGGQVVGAVGHRLPRWEEVGLQEAAEHAAEVVETRAAGATRASPRDAGVPPSATDPPGAAAGAESEPEPDEGVVVYRPGMSMEDLEREAIRAALVEVGGNRRKAAERLGIGERTLYRKIQKFELEP